MASKHKPVDVRRPGASGHLNTRASSSIVGIANFRRKRDFRRDLDQEVQREGFDYFWPITSGDFELDPGEQPFPLDPGDSGPITLVHEAIRPNGQRAIIVGTPTSLYRFDASLEGVYEDGVFVADTFVDGGSATWQTIGTGFSGHRWEADEISGYTRLNNGVDLPVTYQIGDSEVKPIYELRELGYASFGTGCEFKSISMFGDTRELALDYFGELFRPVGVGDSDDVIASQSGTAITTAVDFFESGMDLVTDAGYWVGRTIVFDDGTESLVSAWVSKKQVTALAAATVGPPGSEFSIRVKAAQAGSTSSSSTTAAISSGSQVVTATSAFFTAAMVGKYIRLSNGWMAKITSLVGPSPSNQCNVDTDPTPDSFTGLTFRIVSDMQPGFRTPPPATDFTDYKVIASAPIFEAGMEGRVISWDDGTTREIYSVIDNVTVVVDSDLPIASGFFAVENPESYGAVTNASKYNRYHYRVAWGIPEEPRIYGAVLRGSIDAGSNILILDFPAMSIESGMEIVISGAGVNGGNLTANGVYVAANRVIVLDQFASESVSSAAVQRTISFGSYAGYDDPPGDSSAIIRMKELSGYLVIYKDKSNVFAQYTGNQEFPFAWNHKGLAGDGLYHKWSLCQPFGANYHMYLGRNAIYTLDITTQKPQYHQTGMMCSNVVFDVAREENTKDIIACDNQLTCEVFFRHGIGDDPCLVWSYKYDNWSTTAIDITAGATVGAPVSEDKSPVRQAWFVFSTGSVVLLYGLADQPVASWSPDPDNPTVSAIFYRRDHDYWESDYPQIDAAKKLGYECSMLSGMEHFGAPYFEKHIRSVVVDLATQTTTGYINWSLLLSRHDSETPSVEWTVNLPDARTGCLIPCHANGHLIGYELSLPATLQADVQNIGSQVRVIGHTFDIAGVKSCSWVRLA